jgi:lipopolysaccharide transport system permease protein
VSASTIPRPRLLPRFSFVREHGQLLRTLLRRELRARYQGSTVGVLWTYLQPLLMMGIYTLVFSVLLNAAPSIHHYPQFALTGLAVWTFFQGGLLLGTSSIVANGALIKKVWFPREVILVAVVLSQASAMLVMLVVIVPANLVVIPATARTMALALPLLLLLALLTLGMAAVTCTLNVFFRDVEHLLAVLFLPWFFLTPVLYSLEQLPAAADHGWLIDLMRYGNPVTPYVEGFRATLLQATVPGAGLLVYIFVVGPALALLGLWVVQRYEDRLAVEL